MASPQRPDPDFTPHRDFDQPAGVRPGRPTAGRRARFLLWWLIAVLIAAGIFWWIAWGWGGSGGNWFRHPAPRQASSTPSTTGPGLPTLNAADKTPFIGKPFQVDRVTVQDKVSDQVLWVGADNSTATLVVLNGAGNSAGHGAINTGSVVNVTGTVQKAPPEAQSIRQWKLSSAGAARLKAQGAYVEGQAFLAKPVTNSPAR